LKKDPPTIDEEEGDISDDPFLSAVFADLGSVEKWNDYKLIVALGVILGIAFFYDRSGLKSPWLDALGVIIILGVIGLTIFRVVREKQNVAVRHGLRCPACSYVPRADVILSVATTERCMKCGSKLRPNKPVQADRATRGG